MQRTAPFSRARALIAAVAAALASGIASTIQEAQATAGSYRSRGHGRGLKSGRKQGRRGYNWPPDLLNQNGPIPVARRLRQIAKGMLRVPRT